MKPVKTHTFMGKKYDVYVGPLRGLTDFGESDPSIWIRTSQISERMILNTVIHECLHACKYDKDEKFVNKAATDISRLLWRLGYRRKK